MQPCFHFMHLLFLVFIRALYFTLPLISIGAVKLQNWHLTERVTRQVVQCYISLPAEKLANEVLCSRLEMHMVNWSVLHLSTSAAWKLHAKHNPHNELGLSSQKLIRFASASLRWKKTNPLLSLLELQTQNEAEREQTWLTSTDNSSQQPLQRPHGLFGSLKPRGSCIVDM